MKTYLPSLALLLIALLVSVGGMGCNTFRGAGTDIKKGGEAIEGATLDSDSMDGAPVQRSSAIQDAATPTFTT